MWLLPTLNRIEKLKNFLSTAVEAETSTPGFIIVDVGDWERNKVYYEALTLPKDWEYVQTTSITMGEKCRETWTKIPVEAKWVGILNDDHHIVTKHWDKKLIEVLDGKNFSNSNDRKNFPMKATTATVWSKDLLDALGWPIYPPELQHLFIDDVWENLGLQTGCWVKCADVIVEHKHVIFGQAQEDETHRSVYNEKFYTLERSKFENFMKFDFQEAVNKIKALQDKPMGLRFDSNYNKPNKGLHYEQSRSNQEQQV